MMDFINKLREKIMSLLGNLDRNKKILLIGLSIFFVVAIAFLILFITSEDYVPLASNLTVNEAATIDAKLTELGITHKDQNTTTILVPKDELSKAKMALALEGVYNKKDFTWTDVFAQSSITMTSDEKSKMHLLAQANALASAIETIDGIEEAIVNLYVPDDSAYLINDNMESRASCILKMRSNITLNQGQVNGIQMILLNSVKGLERKNISIIDNTGRELTNSSSYDENFNANNQYDMKVEIEKRLDNNLTNLLANIFGNENVKVMPSVKLDFDKKQTTSTVFQPPNEEEQKGLIRSMSKVSENVQNADEGGAPGTDSNGANTQYSEVEGEGSNYAKLSQTINYELNQINTTIQKAEGTITDISVAVIINTKALKDEILNSETKQEIEKIVSASAGLQTKVVQVSAMEFTDQMAAFDKISSEESAASFPIILVASVVVAFLIILAVVIMLMRRKAQEREVELTRQVEETEEKLDEITSKDEDQSSPKYQINKFIEKNPDAVAQLLRSWINE